MLYSFIENFDATDPAQTVSFGKDIDRPFDAIGVQEIHDKIAGQTDSKRLSDGEIRELIENPELTISDRLPTMSEQDNAARIQQLEDEKIHNLSVKQIARNTSTTFHDIMDDLLDIDGNFSLSLLMDIFTRRNRLIYIGIMLFFFSVGFMLIRLK